MKIQRYANVEVVHFVDAKMSDCLWRIVSSWEGNVSDASGLIS